METPLLYRQLMSQLRQWVQPKDQRHLQGFAEAITAILLSQSACLGQWITYLGHRGCQARARMTSLIISGVCYPDLVLDSGLRDAQALSRLVMLLDSAMLIALIVGWMLVQTGQRSRLDWHSQRGLSFLQLGLREIARCCYERIAVPILKCLLCKSPPTDCASRSKQDQRDCRIEFSKVVVFSA